MTTRPFNTSYQKLVRALDAGEIPPLAVDDGSGERIASGDAELHSRLMLQALELDNKLFTGKGAVRRLPPAMRSSSR